MGGLFSTPTDKLKEAIQTGNIDNFNKVLKDFDVNTFNTNFNYFINLAIQYKISNWHIENNNGDNIINKLINKAANIKILNAAIPSIEHLKSRDQTNRHNTKLVGLIKNTNSVMNTTVYDDTINLINEKIKALPAYKGGGFRIQIINNN
jgi:hypothetical protein